MIKLSKLRDLKQPAPSSPFSKVARGQWQWLVPAPRGWHNKIGSRRKEAGVTDMSGDSAAMAEQAWLPGSNSSHALSSSVHLASLQQAREFWPFHLLTQDFKRTNMETVMSLKAWHKSHIVPLLPHPGQNNSQAKFRFMRRG